MADKKEVFTRIIEVSPGMDEDGFCLPPDPALSITEEITKVTDKDGTVTATIKRV